VQIHQVWTFSIFSFSPQNVWYSQGSLVLIVLRHTSRNCFAKYPINVQLLFPNKIKEQKFPSAQSILSSVAALSFLSSSAIRASYRLVFEAFLFVELLLTYCESEFVVAISANDCLICHHNDILLSYSFFCVY